PGLALRTRSPPAGPRADRGGDAVAKSRLEGRPSLRAGARDAGWILPTSRRPGTRGLSSAILAGRQPAIRSLAPSSPISSIDMIPERTPHKYCEPNSSANGELLLGSFARRIFICA